MAYNMRGPKPIPTALKLVRGNPGCRPLNKNEPQPTRGVGPCPEGLSDVARAEWGKVVPELERLGMLALVDSPSLEAYCDAIAVMREARREIKKHGIMTEGERGYVKNPAVAIQKEAALLVRQFAAEFGLTPSARVRLKAPEAPKRDALEDFLRNGQAG